MTRRCDDERPKHHASRNEVHSALDRPSRPQALSLAAQGLQACRTAGGWTGTIQNESGRGKIVHGFKGQILGGDSRFGMGTLFYFWPARVPTMVKRDRPRRPQGGGAER